VCVCVTGAQVNRCSVGQLSSIMMVIVFYGSRPPYRKGLLLAARRTQRSRRWILKTELITTAVITPSLWRLFLLPLCLLTIGNFSPPLPLIRSSHPFTLSFALSLSHTLSRSHSLVKPSLLFPSLAFICIFLPRHTHTQRQICTKLHIENK